MRNGFNAEIEILTVHTVSKVPSAVHTYNPIEVISLNYHE